MLITVLTPTYNRGYIINNLYKSLLKQTDKNFEWIVIDDGSEDETEKIFQEILKRNELNLKYFKKENGGKHTALNLGIAKAKGEIVIIVDSDDYLIDEAIEKIRKESQKILDDDVFAGICFRRMYINNKQIIGTQSLKEKYIDIDLISYKYKKEVGGDLAECYKLEILKKYLFPIYEGEKFVPEALVWNRIAQKYKMRFFNREAIYMCEYLPDGYSQQFCQLRKNNPKAYEIYYKEVIRYKNIPIKRKIQCIIRLLQIKFYQQMRLK